MLAKCCCRKLIFINFQNFLLIHLPYLPMAMVLAGIAPDRNPLLGEQLEVLVRQLSVRKKRQQKLKMALDIIISFLVAAIEMTL
jgi:hypothetical protein